MGIAACVAEECGEAIEYAYSLTARAHVKCGRRVEVPANVQLTPIITF